LRPGAGSSVVALLQNATRPKQRIKEKGTDRLCRTREVGTTAGCCCTLNKIYANASARLFSSVRLLPALPAAQDVDALAAVAMSPANKRGSHEGLARSFNTRNLSSLRPAYALWSASVFSSLLPLSSTTCNVLRIDLQWFMVILHGWPAAVIAPAHRLRPHCRRSRGRRR
jgi:hypothetical protein